MGSALGTVTKNPLIGLIDPLGQFLGLQTMLTSLLESACVGPAGRRLVALFSGGLARAHFSGELLIEGGLPKGSAPPTVRKVWLWERRRRQRNAVDERGRFEGTGERSSHSNDLAAVQV